MEYPSLAYKDGGKYKRPGGTYSYRAINSDSDLAAAKKLGWCLSMAELAEGLQEAEAKPKKRRTKTPKKPKKEATKMAPKNNNDSDPVLVAAALVTSALVDVDADDNDSGADEGE
jgi:hypothetical protein